MIITIRLIYILATTIVIFLVNACGKITDTPDGCVVAFIVAAEQHDMNKAWNHLSTEAQSYYNGLGEKQRRSGKGALEKLLGQIMAGRLDGDAEAFAQNVQNRLA